MRSDVCFDPVCDIEVVAGVCYQQQQFARSSSSMPVTAVVFCWIMKVQAYIYIVMCSGNFNYIVYLIISFVCLLPELRALHELL